MLGISEILLILIVALLLFGPKKLPEIARSLGHFMGEFTRAKREADFGFNRDFMNGAGNADLLQNPRAEGQNRNEGGVPLENTPECRDAKVLRIASMLNINTEGKTEEEIIDDIKSVSSRIAEKHG